MTLVRGNNKFLIYNGQLISYTASSSGYDTDAQIYFTAVETAGGTLTTDEKDRVNTFVVSCKSTGEWSLMKAVYPMRGDGSGAMSINLKEPGTFDLTFVNVVAGDFTSDGWTGNGSSYANTYYNHSVNANLSSHHFSYDCGSVGDNDNILKCFIGIERSGNYNRIYTRSISSISSRLIIRLGDASSDCSFFPASNIKGFYMVSRVSDIDLRSYKNNIQENINTNLNAAVGINRTYMLNSYNSGLVGVFSNYLCKFASIGDGLTTSEVGNLNTYVATLNSDR